MLRYHFIHYYLKLNYSYLAVIIKFIIKITKIKNENLILIIIKVSQPFISILLFGLDYKI